MKKFYQQYQLWIWLTVILVAMAIILYTTHYELGIVANCIGSAVGGAVGGYFAIGLAVKEFRANKSNKARLSALTMLNLIDGFPNVLPEDLRQAELLETSKDHRTLNYGLFVGGIKRFNQEFHDDANDLETYLVNAIDETARLQGLLKQINVLEYDLEKLLFFVEQFADRQRDGTQLSDREYCSQIGRIQVNKNRVIDQLVKLENQLKHSITKIGLPKEDLEKTAHNLRNYDRSRKDYLKELQKACQKLTGHMISAAEETMTWYRFADVYRDEQLIHTIKNQGLRSREIYDQNRHASGQDAYLIGYQAIVATALEFGDLRIYQKNQDAPIYIGFKD